MIYDIMPHIPMQLGHTYCTYILAYMCSVELSVKTRLEPWGQNQQSVYSMFASTPQYQVDSEQPVSSEARQYYVCGQN